MIDNEDLVYIGVFNKYLKKAFSCYMSTDYNCWLAFAVIYKKQNKNALASLQQITNIDHRTEMTKCIWATYATRWICRNSDGSDIRGHRAGEGHAMSRYPFFSQVGWSYGASQWRSGGRMATVSIRLVETQQQPVLFLFHPHPVFPHQLTGDTEQPLLFYLCSSLLWIILHWFWAKNPVCEVEKHESEMKYTVFCVAIHTFYTLSFKWTQPFREKLFQLYTFIIYIIKKKKSEALEDLSNL